MMKRLFRILSILTAVGAVMGWLALGANTGWTKTSVPVKIVDEVTGIEGVEYRNQFNPGLELLAAALVGAGLLGSASFLFRKPITKQTIK